MNGMARHLIREGAATVGRDVEGRGQHVHALRVFRIAAHLRIVLGAAHVGIGLLPAGAAVIGAVYAALGPLDVEIHGVRLAAANRHPDASHVTRRQAVGQLVPGIATVGAAPDTTVISGGDPAPVDPLPMPRGGVQHIRVTGIEVEIHESGVGAGRQYLPPGVTTIGRSIEAASLVGVLDVVHEWPDHRNKDDILIARIDADTTDMQ